MSEADAAIIEVMAKAVPAVTATDRLTNALVAEYRTARPMWDGL